MEVDALELLERLHQKTGFLSFHNRDEPLFKQIVAQGTPAVKPLLNKLKTDPCWWSMLALWEILPDRPEVPEGAAGMFSVLADLTVKWVEEHPAVA